MRKLSRRGFLLGSTTLLATTAISRSVDAGVLARLFGSPSRETTSFTPNDDFYVTSYSSTSFVKIEEWSLQIKGLVKKPLTLSYNDLLKRRQTTMVATLECIGNPVGGDSIGNATWEGMKLNTLLDEAGVDPRAVDLVLRGEDGYSDSFPAKRAMQNEVLLATRMNGQPLPAEHGFPARVIVPGIYGMKNVKWLTELELVDHDYKGYWEKGGWSDQAEVITMSRINDPGDNETLKPGEYTIRGVAFSGIRGIQKVEISTDAGRTWQLAELDPILSPYAWRLWGFRWKIPSTGRYTLIVRATDGEGNLQPEKRQNPFPAGKTGLHAVSVKVHA